MSLFLKLSGWLGALLTIVVLVIALLKQVIAFVGFLMFAIKVGLVLIFIALLAFMVYLFLRDRHRHRKEADGH
jgi:membrane protein implicated in regulation of membrane protease activity